VAVASAGGDKGGDAISDNNLEIVCAARKHEGSIRRVMCQL
jgi:hypothetical protein